MNYFLFFVIVLIKKRLRCSKLHCSRQVPYNGKFSLVQNFADPPFTHPKEIFVVLIFTSSLHKDHTHVYNNT